MTWATTTTRLRRLGRRCARAASLRRARPPPPASRRGLARRPGCSPSEATVTAAPRPGRRQLRRLDDADRAASSEESEAERSRLIALVELARGGDGEAFGQLYDHYHGSVYRFLYYRTRSATPGRGPHLRDLLPGAAQHERLPLAGQGLRRLADDDRPQPRHRPLQGRPHPARARPPRTWARTTTPPRAPRARSSPALTNEVLLDGAHASCPTSSATA